MCPSTGELKKCEVRIFTNGTEKLKLNIHRKCMVSIYLYIHTHYLLLTYSLDSANIKTHLPLERDVIILGEKGHI